MIVAIEGPESKKGRNIFSQFFSSTKVTSVQAVDSSSIASEGNENADGESNEIVDGENKNKETYLEVENLAESLASQLQQQ